MLEDTAAPEGGWKDVVLAGVVNDAVLGGAEKTAAVLVAALQTATLDEP